MEVVQIPVTSDVQEGILSSIRYITDFERETYRILSQMRRRRRVISTNFIIDEYLSLGGKIDNIPHDFMIGYSDVYHVDKLLLEPNDQYKEATIYVLMLEGYYLGHVYSWISEGILHVQGIRTSIYNALLRNLGMGIKGTASILLSYLVDNTDMPISVQLPLDVMIPILEKHGFKEDDEGNYTL